MKLSTTSDSSTNRRFVLLSPPGLALRNAFRNVETNSDWRQELIADMQRLRGRIYLQDGAISQRDLTADGRHIESIDEQSWHLLILNSDNRVVGCTRYLQHSANTSFNRLRARTSPLAESDQWSEAFRSSVESELMEARNNGFSYIEVGGWAVDESVRGSSDAIRSVLFTYAWSQVIGGCLGLSTATHRNGSASILRRIGGKPLEFDGQELPPYYDAHYGCEMEVIRFDSRVPSQKYAHAIAEIKAQIPNMPVVSNRKSSGGLHVVVNPQQSPCVLPWLSDAVASAA